MPHAPCESCRLSRPQALFNSVEGDPERCTSFNYLDKIDLGKQKRGRFGWLKTGIAARPKATTFAALLAGVPIQRASQSSPKLAPHESIRAAGRSNEQTSPFFP